jgi:hypothetical protein
MILDVTTPKYTGTKISIPCVCFFGATRIPSPEAGKESSVQSVSTNVFLGVMC